MGPVTPTGPIRISIDVSSGCADIRACVDHFCVGALLGRIFRKSFGPPSGSRADSYTACRPPQSYCGPADCCICSPGTLLSLCLAVETPSPWPVTNQLEVVRLPSGECGDREFRGPPIGVVQRGSSRVYGGVQQPCFIRLFLVDTAQLNVTAPKRGMRRPRVSQAAEGSARSAPESGRECLSLRWIPRSGARR